MDRPSPSLSNTAIIAAICVMVFVILVVSGMADRSRAEYADSTADWLVASAVVDGVDPYSNLFELASLYKVDYWPEASADSRVEQHPRTPGALLLLLPLAWLSVEEAFRAMLLLGFAAAALGTIATTRQIRVPLVLAAFTTAVALLMGPSWWSYFFATQSHIVMLCLALFLIELGRPDRIRAGFLLAVAVVLKLFPLVLVAYLVFAKRWRAVFGFLASTALLSLPLVVTGKVEFLSAVDALVGTVGGWVGQETNVSLYRLTGDALPTPAVVGLVAIAGGSIGVAIWKSPLMKMPACSGLLLLSFSLLLAPVVWPHYLVALLPFFVVSIRELEDHRGMRIALLIGLPLVAAPEPTFAYTVFLAYTVLILLVVLRALSKLDREHNRLAITTQLPFRNPLHARSAESEA